MAKSKNQSASSVAVLIVFGLLLSGVYGVDKSMNSGSSQDDGSDDGLYDECYDGIDNDNDGYADADDAECDPYSPWYTGKEQTPDDQLGEGPP
jgi:hypothetical protein